MDAVSMAKPSRRDVTGSSSVRPRGDTFSACRLSEYVMRVPCALHTALRGSSREVAALGCN